MCAVMLAMKTMLPPVFWAWRCLTKSWAAKKEPRDFGGVLDLDFLFFWIFFFFVFLLLLERNDNIR